MPAAINAKTRYRKNGINDWSIWTIILFIAAENDLLEDMKDIYDQLAKVGSNPGEVNFVVIFDGLNIRKKKKRKPKAGSSKSAKKSRNKRNEGHVTIYHVTRYNYFTEVTDNCKFSHRFARQYDDLTKEANLVHVLSVVKEKFPADNYGLIFKGHGGPNPDINDDRFTSKVTLRKILENGKIETDEQIKMRMAALMGDKNWEVDSILGLHEGPIRGQKPPLSSNRPEAMLLVLYRNPKQKSLSYLTLSKVIKDVFCDKDKPKHKLSLLVLDCCWGQTLENGAAFKDVTEYLVASADEMAILGIGYEGFCDFLLKQPQIKPSELANFIVAEYFRTEFNDYLSSPEWKYMGVSLTCVETTYLNDVINAFSSLSSHLSQNMVTHFYIIHLARLQCMAYTYENNEDDFRIYNIDLIWFLENLQEYNKSSSGTAVDEKLEQLISELLRLLSLYYIKSYLASNYLVKKPGEKGVIKRPSNRPFIESVIGGKGIGIIFPSTRKQFNLSIYADIDEIIKSKKKKKNDLEEFLTTWEWAKFLSQYVKHKARVNRGSNSIQQEELTAFTNSPSRRYLDYYNDKKNGNLETRLNNAREWVSQNLPHKWEEFFSVPKKRK